MTRKQIPLNDDLAVCARMAVRYHSDRSAVNLALFVLSQRVVVEKSKKYLQRRKASISMREIELTVNRFGKDIDFARAWSESLTPEAAIFRAWPSYRQFIFNL